MTSKNRYLTTALLCAAAFTLNSARFDGVLHFIEYADFPLCLIALHVIFLGPGETLAACLACGFMIDASTGLRLPLHIAAFLLYAAAGARLSGIFYSPKSLPNAVAQILLVSIFDSDCFLIPSPDNNPAHIPAPIKFLINSLLLNCI
mgnify:CR=1 FL=1